MLFTLVVCTLVCGWIWADCACPLKSRLTLLQVNASYAAYMSIGDRIILSLPFSRALPDANSSSEMGSRQPEQVNGASPGGLFALALHAS